MRPLDPTGMFEGGLDVCGSLDDAQLAGVPARRGVLLLLDERGNPIILLTAADLRARLRSRLREGERQPSRRADLREVTRRILWKLACGHFETDLHFLKVARTLWPKRYPELLSWKRAWFVHVDPDAEYPHFSRTRDVFTGGGEHFGPMPDGRSAERFVAALQDGFDLCRHYRLLRKAPDAQPCAYGQMGRCLSPCDGSVSMTAYRRVVAEAAAFAGGRRDEMRDLLTKEMNSAASNLRFEHAASVKARLERLAELDSPAFANVRPADEFRFILVQRGPSRQKARTFLADRGVIVVAGDLNYPLKEPQLAGLLDEMSALASRREPVADEVGAWRVGLVARYLASSEKRRGLIMHWRPETSAEQLAEAIEGAKDILRLRERKARGRRKSPAGPAETSQGKPVIGIVGGVGAGKSTVAAAFGDMGCAVIDADAVGHELLGDGRVRAELRNRWGDGIFAAAGAVDRGALGRIVFGNEAELAALDAILHPRIRRRVEDRIAAGRTSPDAPAIVLDAAVLLEAGWDDLCTHLVFVRAPADERCSRATRSRGWDDRDWRRREKSQISLDKKANCCEYIIDNSFSASRLYEQVRQLLHRIAPAEGHP